MVLYHSREEACQYKDEFIEEITKVYQVRLLMGIPSDDMALIENVGYDTKSKKPIIYYTDKDFKEIAKPTPLFAPEYALTYLQDSWVYFLPGQYMIEVKNNRVCYIPSTIIFNADYMRKPIVWAYNMHDATILLEVQDIKSEKACEIISSCVTKIGDAVLALQGEGVPGRLRVKIDASIVDCMLDCFKGIIKVVEKYKNITSMRIDISVTGASHDKLFEGLLNQGYQTEYYEVTPLNNKAWSLSTGNGVKMTVVSEEECGNFQE